MADEVIATEALLKEWIFEKMKAEVIFVLEGKGHGRRLFERMQQDYERKEFTVNSSPYAVPIYHKLGFRDTDKEQTVDGLRFTPMMYIK